MGLITSNPTISLQANIGAPLIYYFADGAAIFGCIGSPEGVIAANKRSIAITETGAIYVKTTDIVDTGWNLVSSGSSGTVTSVGLTAPTALFNSPATNSPVTTAGTLDLTLATQNANRVFAGPSTGAAATPTFRALVAADLALAAAPPSNGLQYNDGTNAFTASNGFKVDPATNTLQVGELNVLKGALQLQAGSGGGSYKITTSVPSTNHVWILPDAAPTVDQLLKVIGVSGANYTLGYISPSGLGFASVNPTSGVIPYNNAGSFADSQLTRTSASILTLSTGQFSVPVGTSTAPSIRFGGSDSFGFYQGGNAGNGLIARVNGNPEFCLFDGNTGFIGIGTTRQFGWGNVTTAAADTGLARPIAAMVRVSNGGTGAGKLGVGTSTITTANQFSVDSQSTTVIAGYFSMPNGSSVATVQGVTNSIQSFALNPTGKIVGGMNVPTTNQQTAMIGNAKSDVSTIGNVGTGTDNLLSFVIQANVLANAGDYAEFDAFGEFAANGNTKQLQVVYGATTIFNTGAVAFTSSNWRMNVKILRTGASAGKSIATFWSSDGTTSFQQEIFITTESFTANKTVQWTATATANDDITQLHLESKLVTALTS